MGKPLSPERKAARTTLVPTDAFLQAVYADVRQAASCEQRDLLAADARRWQDEMKHLKRDAQEGRNSAFPLARLDAVLRKIQRVILHTAAERERAKRGHLQDIVVAALQEEDMEKARALHRSFVKRFGYDFLAARKEE